MKFLIILSFVLTINIAFAQGRKDTLRMKDGNEILCQILNISESDSIIQFCIRENGDLTVKKVHTSFVDSYSWPGKKQAVKYSRMLGVKNIQSGVGYNDYWLNGNQAQKHSPGTPNPLADELRKAKTLGTISFAAIGAGLVTAVVVPEIIKSPVMNGSNINTYFKDVQKYGHTSQVCRRVGFTVATAGVVVGLLSLNHLTIANNLKKEAGKSISLSVTGNGLSMAFSF